MRFDPQQQQHQQHQGNKDAPLSNGHLQPFKVSKLSFDFTGTNDSAPIKAATVQEIVDQQDADADVVRAGRCCTVVFLPFIVVALLLGTIFGVSFTNGRALDVEGVPRAVLFIIEGFKGTTFNELLEGQRLPHIRQMLLEQHGVYAACASLEDVRCARAVLVEDDVTGEAFISAGAGIATILTGVFPRRHGVRNDTWMSYAALSSTSVQFPSVALRVTLAKKRAAALGGPHLLNGLDARTGQCNVPGVLDAECVTPPVSVNSVDANELNRTQPAATLTDGVDHFDIPPMMTCLHLKSCNLFKRAFTLSSGRDGREEREFTRGLIDLFGGLSSEGQEAGNSYDNSLLIFNLNALALRAGEESLRDFTYDQGSLEYAAQAFLIDSLVGQVLAFVQDRARSRKENWLVVGTSNHGGVGKSFGNFGDEDEVVPFFLATYTSNRRGYRRLRPLTRPVTHMDAAPTILKWLGIAPYDEDDEEEEKQNYLEGGDNTDRREETGWQHNDHDQNKPAASKTRNSPSNTGDQRTLLDGVPQGICGSGLRTKDCAVAEGK
ncbi:hypothetical protein TCDM_05030 [Trypanosoma cruzi Dm28c]|uniref:Uncharacterized protein n=1 Tax=Trypanosoma cruzi Dm28c TaxID=1416333 RepID=V5AZS1_TRYCR|nr:hypothetical protein TCDM_05030 [Trypanosoma cruzi Dm28c]